MAHIDVVDARREDWSVDPYTFLERDGYYYARGSTDNKAGAATLVANFIRYRQEGYVPERDLILVLTGDEETTSNSIKALIEQHRDLVDAEYALNTDAGGGELRDGKAIAFSVQTAEKVYLSFQLEVRNRGGHSSVPEPDNAIYRLSEALTRLSRHTFPVRLNATTRAFFAELGRDPTPFHRRRHGRLGPVGGSSRGATAFRRSALLQLGHANDLCRDSALRGARRQRPSPARPRHGELPDAAGRSGGQRRSGAAAGAGRYRDFPLPIRSARCQSSFTAPA
jgi:hypothetical protein